MEGLGSLSIQGIGAIEYKIETNSGKLEMLSIPSAYYVPDMKTRLISPQKNVLNIVMTAITKAIQKNLPLSGACIQKQSLLINLTIFQSCILHLECPIAFLYTMQ